MCCLHVCSWHLHIWVACGCSKRHWWRREPFELSLPPDTMVTLWEFRFLQCCQTFKSPGMLCYVTRYRLPNISKDHNAFIFRVSSSLCWRNTVPSCLGSQVVLCLTLTMNQLWYFATPETTYAIKHSITSQHVLAEFNHQETLLKVKHSYNFYFLKK